MTLVTVCALALASAVPAPNVQTSHSPPTSAAQIDPARRSAGMVLAKVVRSEAYVRSETALLFKGAFAEELSKNEDIAELELEYPGITAAMIGAAKPAIEAAVLKTLPQLWTEMADIYASTMSVAEIEQARAYYESPSGRRLLELIIGNIDVRTFASEVAAEPDRPFAVGDLNQLQSSGMPSAVQQLTIEERADLMRFSATPAFSKISALNPHIQQAVVKWSNAKDPEADAVIDKAMAAAIDRFIEAADKKDEK